jgi:hypothetical protein
MKTTPLYHCSRIPQLQRQSLLATVIVLVVVICSVPALADGCIPYCNVGTIAPTNIFTATLSGDINGYFVSKGSADDDDFVRMLDITTGTVGPWVLENQTTTIGTMADFGAATAGDTLVFELINYTQGGLSSRQTRVSARTASIMLMPRCLAVASSMSSTFRPAPT